MVAQPFKRGAKVCAPGKIDRSIGEFWVDNPWDIPSAGHNLSNHERQRFFLNHQGEGFFDLSYLSGADVESDGRSVVAGDFRNNGQLDVVVRKCGGGPFTIYENQFPRQHYLEVSLRGRKSNRLGIGARLVAKVKGRQIVRDMYPANGYHGQMPSRVHFGLAGAAKVDELTIRWPSGEVQVLRDLAADRHLGVTESLQGSAAIETIVPGRLFAP